MSEPVNEQQFGTAEDYTRAFQQVLAEGIPDHHRAILQAHFDAPHHITTWEQLAERVGYADYRAVNLKYGQFAKRVARRLGVVQKPLDPNGTAWWLWVLVRWAHDPDPVSGHITFVLRHPVVEALRRTGIAHEPEET